MLANEPELIKTKNGVKPSGTTVFSGVERTYANCAGRNKSGHTFRQILCGAATASQLFAEIFVFENSVKWLDVEY